MAVDTSGDAQIIDGSTHKMPGAAATMQLALDHLFYNPRSHPTIPTQHRAGH